MSAVIILIISLSVLLAAYLTYGSWLAKKWGVEPGRRTPAHTLCDGRDYVPAKAPVLLGHHFSSIAGVAPINGPIQAAVFGWLPVLLWILIGGIFFGAVQDFASLFASVRHKGQSIGVVISQNIGSRAKKLFLVFSYLTLLLVVGAFSSIVADTFNGFTENEAGQLVHNTVNGTAAAISCLFIALALPFGYFVYRRRANMLLSTLVGIAAIIGCIAIGLHFPIFLSARTWLIILGVYILIASILPVWILLQPRDYLSSFLLYGMMLLAVAGILGANPTMELPAYTGFGGIDGTSHLFPVLFITVACGAISGFHSLVGSGTTSKQLDREGDAKLIGYGGMLIECVLAVIALITVSYLFKDGIMPGGAPTQVFASGLATMINTFGETDLYETVYALLILAVSAFALTSLDTGTRLARYMFQEFFLEDGKTYKQARGYKRVLTDPFVATAITVVLGISLGFGGYSKIWVLFGAANQLLAALALLAVAAWMGNLGRSNKMFLLPMGFMLAATLTSLVLTLVTKGRLIASGSGDLAAYLQVFFSAALVALAIVLMGEGIQALAKKRPAAAGHKRI